MNYSSDLMKTANNIHFIGIGGVSMSSLALLALKNGKTVTGSDRTASPVTDMLESSGIKVYHSHSADNVTGTDAVVYNAAISESNPELHHAHELGIKCVTRAAFLGEIMLDYDTRIGVCGTHGKSTTTTMLSHIFLSAGLDPTILNGAVMPELGSAYHIGSNENFIFEACEYTDSFLSMFPTTAVVLNIEMDHTDYFHTMEQLRGSFTTFMNIGQTAVYNIDDVNCKLAVGDFKGKAVSFGIESQQADYRAVNLTYKKGRACFDIAGLCEGIQLPFPGKHLVYDALAAAAAAHENGVSGYEIAKALCSFVQAKRRLEFKGQNNGIDVYDDFAHHPSEIKAELAAVKQMGYNNIICLFQPHTYSRTAMLFDDFAEAFGDADTVIMADIYAAREVNTFGITSQKLTAAIGEKAFYVPSFGEAAELARSKAESGDIILTMGAGEMYKAGDIFLNFTF